MTRQILEIIKQRQDLCLADKIHLMADSLRNAKIQQCKGKFYEPKTDSMCAYGVLGFMSGMPKSELLNHNFTKVLANYGIDLDESSKLVALPEDAQCWHYPQREVSLFQGIYQLNDQGYSFTEVADKLDNWADDLQG